jgi:hypothetical protein
MATKQEILSKLAASHEQRISKVLFDLEEDIIAQLQRATDGVPLTTDLAIQLRPNLKQLIEQNYLKEGSRIISEYDEVVKGYMDYIRTTPVSDKFKTLTKPDLVLINQLKQLSFSGFEDVANRFLDTIATEIYSSAVTGKPFPQVVENIRASVNGVYRRSNEAAVNRLVRIVEENRYSDDPIAKKKYLDARKILHSKYASDIRGENMRKYASQIAHDSIMQFDGQFTKYKGQEAGINTYKYTGTNITTTRQFCRANLNEIKSEEEWRDVFTGNWRGKSGSDPFVNRGGYRCRHSLIPYDPAWDEEEVQEQIKQEEKKNLGFGKSGSEEKNLLSSFKDIKDDENNTITKAITFLPPLKKYLDKGQKSYYERGSDTLSISRGHQTTTRFDQVYRHEYGHRIDDNIIGKLDETKRKRFKEKLMKIGGFEDAPKSLRSSGDIEISVNLSVINLRQVSSTYASRKILNDRKNLNKQFRESRNKNNMIKFKTPTDPQEFDKYLDDVLRDNPEFPLTKSELKRLVDPSNKKEILGLITKSNVDINLSSMDDFMDYVGAITNEKIGFGHGTAYYRKFSKVWKESGLAVTEGHTSEAIANYISLTTEKEFGGIYKKLMNYYAPETTQAFEEILKEIGDIL